MLVLSVDGCSGGVRPYRAMVKAARSELSPVTLARDQRLKLHLREAILVDQTFAGSVDLSACLYGAWFCRRSSGQCGTGRRYSTSRTDGTGASESEGSSTGTETGS